MGIVSTFNGADVPSSEPSLDLGSYKLMDSENVPFDLDVHADTFALVAVPPFREQPVPLH